MNPTLPKNLQYVAEKIKDIDEVRTNLYLMQNIKMYISKPSRTLLTEVMAELNRVFDKVQRNEYNTHISRVMEKLDILIPAITIVDASATIDNAIEYQQILSKEIFNRIVKIRTEKINEAKLKLGT